MLQVFPFIAWLATVTSAVLLILLWILGEVRRRDVALLAGGFVLAAYCQFAAGSPVVAAVGLILQTILAVYLLLRWRVGA